MTPLSADNSTTGWTVISNSSGSCIAKPVQAPLRPVTSWQSFAPLLVTAKSNTAVVMEIVLARLGWNSPDEGTVSIASTRLRVNYGRAKGSTYRTENAVLRF